MIEDLEEPIGNFILEQNDLKPLITNNGYFYHYSDVCTLLNRLKKEIYDKQTSNNNEKRPQYEEGQNGCSGESC